MEKKLDRTHKDANPWETEHIQVTHSLGKGIKSFFLYFPKIPSYFSR